MFIKVVIYIRNLQPILLQHLLKVFYLFTKLDRIVANRYQLFYRIVLVQHLIVKQIFIIQNQHFRDINQFQLQLLKIKVRSCQFIILTQHFEQIKRGISDVIFIFIQNRFILKILLYQVINQCQTLHINIVTKYFDKVGQTNMDSSIQIIILCFFLVLVYIFC